MTEHAALATQTRGTSRNRDRIVVPIPSHHQVLEQAPDRSDPPVHRRWRRTLSSKSRDRPSRRPPSLLPVEIVEQITRLDICQLQRAIGEEASEVRHIERVRPNCRRREPPNHQVLEKAVPRLHHCAIADKTMTIDASNDTDLGHRRPPQN